MDDEEITPDEASQEDLWNMLEDATGVDRARILHELGARAFDAGEFEQSVALAESAAVQAREAGDELLQARSLFGQAVALGSLGRTKELIEAAMAAADLLRGSGEPAEIARCHGIVASAFSDLGDDVTALEHWSSAARLFESEEQHGSAGHMWMSLGEALGRLGRHEEALEKIDHARGLFRSAGEPGAVPWADDRAASVLIELGRFDEALSRLQVALDVRDAQRDVPRIAYANYRLGWTLRLVGRYEEALSNLSVAAELFDELEDLFGRARCDLEAANSLTSLGQFEEADVLYRRTRAVFDALGHDSQLILSDANRAVMLARNGQTEHACQLNRSLLDRARQAGNEWLLGDIVNHLARNLLDLGRPDEALAVLDEHVDSPRSTPVAVAAAGLRAKALLALGRNGLAARTAEEGLRLAADVELVAERAELHEARAVARLGSRSRSVIVNAERDLAHAVALYLAAGLSDKARDLSTHFLPSQTTLVQRGGGLISEQPEIPDVRSGKSESETRTGNWGGAPG